MVMILLHLACMHQALMIVQNRFGKSSCTGRKIDGSVILICQRHTRRNAGTIGSQLVIVLSKGRAVAAHIEQVPLAVQDQAGDAISDQGTTSITDEQVPLAANAIAKDGVKTWWWWIAAAVAAITGKGAYDHQRRKPAKNDAEDSSNTDNK